MATFPGTGASLSCAVEPPARNAGLTCFLLAEDLMMGMPCWCSWVLPVPDKGTGSAHGPASGVAS
eukprot:677238-Heterocapsa_arctica.AAC.1